ncbi:TIGR02217 family protein, partial [Sphingomonas sp. 2R-10]|uniref:non-contractile tail sheath protein n=1 Tax=Sphingomonas sp. 2R-10 TaxID=3045148 RepID=UPI003FA7D9BE|nr:TIGR02217 family protein [Sphingomonas sp. 2R-10]
MGHWLAEGRTVQEAGVLSRFDPVYWTVDFPRPMMASVVTTAPDALRVTCVFYRRDDLAGLIWASEDRHDHVLLRYDTVRDYRDCRLRFRWRSQGIRPLDATHGPVLTIEGRDAAGVARAWYVRLWNYATGSPEDAEIAIDFATVVGGYRLPGEAVPVWAGDVDRMFVSLVPPDYDAGDGFLDAPVEGWAELSAIRCDGPGSVLGIGDVVVPEHGLRIASGYDDSYHLTPARLLHNALRLGYRGALVHYVGMSHYFRLERSGDGLFVSLAGSVLNGPCAAWHRDFAVRAGALGYDPVWSLSYELFDAHCWGDWKQRAADGSPALTGWVPPSTLLSPAHAGAMAYLQAVARAFVGIGRAAGGRGRFQVGEPWWWVTTDHRICLYDDAARVVLGGDLPVIDDVRGVLDGPRRALLDRAGAMLAASTAALVA